MHAMEAHGRSGGTAPLVLNLDTNGSESSALHLSGDTRKEGGPGGYVGSKPV
jgi:hypothetical protein